MSSIIFLTGTPGVGKTTIAQKLHGHYRSSYLIHLNEFAIENDCVLGTDEEKGYKVIDVVRLNLVLNNFLESISEKYDFIIVEGHLSHFCDGADYLVVLRCQPEILRKRLTKRDYSDLKIHENLEAEAMGVCSLEAYEKYGENVFEIDVSKLDIESELQSIFSILNSEMESNFGSIDFMDWLLE